MLHRLIKRLKQLTAKLNNFIKWGLSKSTLIGVVFAIARVESQIETVKQEEKIGMDIITFNKLIPFNSIATKDRYGYTIEFLANDINNDKNHHRSVKFTYEDGLEQYGEWRYEEGCFKGYGKTLDLAITDLREKTNREKDLCGVKAFLSPTYD